MKRKPPGCDGKIFFTKPLLLSSAGMFLDGYSLTVIAFAIILIGPYFSLNSLESGLVIASVVLGSIIGALLIGYFGDVFGRKPVYILNMAVFVIFGLISALSVNFLMLLLSRFILGIAVGADYPVSNSYIAETAPDGLRGKHLAFSAMSFALGSIFSSLVSAALFPFGPEMWRLMLGIGVIPAAAVMFLRISMPESVMWLSVKKLEKEYAENRIYDKGMFSRTHIKNTLLYSFIWFLYDIGAYGIGLLIPTIFKKTGFVTNEANALITSVILLSGVLSSAVGIAAIDKAGRKYMQLFGFAGMGAALFLLPSVRGELYALAAVILAAEVFNSLTSLTVGIFPAELSHTSFRSSAYGFSAMAGKLGAVCGVIIMTYFVKEGRNAGYYIAAALMLAALFLSMMLPETKGMALDYSGKNEPSGTSVVS